jgi:hypothetical protein
MAMVTSSQRLRAVDVGLAAAFAVYLLAACGGTTVAPSRVSPSSASMPGTQDPTPKLGPPLSDEPGVTAGLGQCGPAPASMATDSFIMGTEWGPIFCTVPDDFPVCPRCEVTDTFGDPVTSVWLGSWEPRSVAVWYRAALEAAGFATASMTTSDAEGGTITIESVGSDPACRAQTSIVGGFTEPDEFSGEAVQPYAYVAVRYGTGCPPP